MIRQEAGGTNASSCSTEARKASNQSSGDGVRQRPAGLPAVSSPEMSFGLTNSLPTAASVLADKVQGLQDYTQNVLSQNAPAKPKSSIQANDEEAMSKLELPTLGSISLVPTVTNGGSSPSKQSSAKNLVEPPSPSSKVSFMNVGQAKMQGGTRISHRLFEEKKLVGNGADATERVCFSPETKENGKEIECSAAGSFAPQPTPTGYSKDLSQKGDPFALQQGKAVKNERVQSAPASRTKESEDALSDVSDENLQLKRPAPSVVVPAPSGPSSGRPQRGSTEKPRRKKEDRASTGRIAEDRWLRLLNEINNASTSSVKATDHDLQRCVILAMRLEDAIENLFEFAADVHLDVVELGKLIRDTIVTRRASSHELRRSQGTSHIPSGSVHHVRGQATYAYKHIQGGPGQLYDLMGEVGAGAFGTVRKATHLKTGEEHAVKCVPKAKVDSSTLWEEIEIMRVLDHPHIMRVYNTFEDDQNIYMCLELCTGGPFFDTLFRIGIIPEGISALLFKQIMNVLSYIHSRHVCHRDIKPENFLVLRKGDVRDAHLKLIDFGSSKRFDLAPMTTKICTPQYVAPEILLKGKISYTEKVDVWSCGVMLYLMLSGRLPFHRDNEIEMLKLVKKGKWDFKPEKLWSIVSDPAKALVGRCLCCEVSERYSASQVLHSEWLHTETTLASRRLSMATIEQVQKYLSESRLKRVALRIIARQINDESICQLRNIFLSLDEDCTGTLSAEEIADAVGRLGVSEMKQRGMVELMCHLDPTGSGMIEYTEFLAATMTPEQYCQEDACKAAFHRLDADMDGVLSRKDLERLLSDPDGRRDAGLAEATLAEIFDEMDHMIREADADHSGGVSLDEFMQLMAEECQMPGDSASSKRKQRGRDYCLKEFMDEMSDGEELDGDDSEEAEFSA